MVFELLALDLCASNDFLVNSSGVFQFMAGITLVCMEHSKGSPRLGETGLAFHYANIISQINIIVSINLLLCNGMFI